MIQAISRWVSVALLLCLPACARDETMFQSDFDATPAGQPPAQAQKVGTVAIDAPAPNSVLVVDPPVTPSGRWVKVERLPQPASASLQANLTASRGEGRYVFTSTMFMPSGTGIVTIQFERFQQPVGLPEAFLHLDFMPQNDVRIDDQEGSRFGSFERNKPFIVQVELNIGLTSSSAHIALAGAAGKGEADRTIPGPVNILARQFGAVRLWVSFPHVGHFNATNIVVIRKG
ncbi:MAG: hypothetical protein ACHQKZ_01120 [Solirubrobacterales bacterium]|jgi:hypothetical protein